MNGESVSVPQVPVITLAGTVSLTELLPELPLPSPVEGSQSRSLLFHPRVAEEAQRHLACKDPALVDQLARALVSTSADHIELKTPYVSGPSAFDLKTAPPLLKGILQSNASAFSGSIPFPVNDLKKPILKLNKLTEEELSKELGLLTPKPAVKENHVNSSRRSRSSRNTRSNYKDEEPDSCGSESEEEDRKKPAKYFKSREKEREEKKRKDKAEKKRKRADSDEDFNPESQKKRKGDDDSEDEEVEEKVEKFKQVSPKKLQYNKKRLERKLEARSAGEKLSSEELMETGVYQRFTRTVEKIFDNTEDIDVNAEIAEEDGDVPQEFMIPKYELSELCSESAKLKSLGAMALVPPERLVRLLNILEKNIRDGGKVTPIVDEDEEEEKLWLELALERILRATDASLTALYILTAPNMSKRVYLEDVIERCVQFAKFQLNNTIYPSFDPVYSLSSRKDGYLGSARRKRAHMKGVRDRNIMNLYNKLHEIVGLIADLLSIQTLTDTTVLFLSSLGVSPFFVENVPELQLSSLRLVTRVFSKYEKHRRLLLDDILASIARLPSSERSLRTYRLNSDENIQMLTALVLQLIQCVVDLPEALSKKETNKSSNTGGKEKESSSINGKASNASNGPKDASEALNVDRDVLISHHYEMAMQTAYSFLSVFLEKTGSKSEDIDYRPLFENFVQDLLLTVNKPEWPAAELLLSFLGKLLVDKFSNKNTEMSLRVSSLDCLGIVAARLRKDAVSSQLKVHHIDQIIHEAKEEENRGPDALLEEVAAPVENGPTPKKNRKKKGAAKSEVVSAAPDSPELVDEEEERTAYLQRLMLDWLAVNSESEPVLLHARHFYIGQWYRDAYAEIIRQKVGPLSSPAHHSSKRSSAASRQKKRRRKRRGQMESSEEESSESENDEEADEGIDCGLDERLKADVLKLSEKRKFFLLSKISPFPPPSPGARTQILRTHIDYESAELITRYLASKRSFSQSFDNYLKQILRVLSESAIAVRTKAMKCLTMVVDADPGVLGRSDMQLGVNHSFLDHSTSVREAAVDLVGKFILLRPELIHKYYEMIAARILDTGVSVRKRVIKIMKDICLEYPDFQKIPEICVKMIRRVNDEEGIKKLVQEVFQMMWFTPVRIKPQLDKDALLLKVNNITEVVIACKDSGLDWFEQLLHSMFRPKEDKEDVTKVVTEPPKALVTACKQIVDCLVNHILVIEEKGFKMETDTINNVVSDPNKGFQPPNGGKPIHLSSSLRLVACLRTLHLFAKIRPHLVIDHAYTLQPYLALKCQTQGDYTVIGTVARTLELVVPLMEHPSETFLSQLEEDAVKLILLHDKSVISSCLALLGSIVNTVTKNYRLIKDCFQKYYSFLVDYKRLDEENKNDMKLERSKPFLRRALYTVGLLLRHFDFKKPEILLCGLADDTTANVVDTLMYFITFPDFNIRLGSLQSVGSVCVRHYDLMLTKRVKELYHRLLLDPDTSAPLKIQTLVNIELYLQEEEIRMIRQDQEWAKMKTKENLKEMCDIQSGMASAIIQVYLNQVLESVISSNATIRQTALRVIQLVLLQGLVHPIQIVPYLIAMSTDVEEIISHSADKQLQEIEKKYPGFINMKAMQGFRFSFRLQMLVQPVAPTRGLKQKKGEFPGALNGFLYSIMRGTKNQRRAVAMSLLKQFDEQARVPLPDLLFIADNLAYFPYQVLDEPLFIIHHIDIMISVTGSNLLQSFKESLKRPLNAEFKMDPLTGQPVYLYDDDDDDETVESILERFPDDPTPLVDCTTASQGCLLILILKQHLKDIYGITDNKIWHYSPSDTSKQYEKSCCNRKSSSKFNPKGALQKIAKGEAEPRGKNTLQMTEEEKQKIVLEYFAFKDLMLKIDRDDDLDSDDEARPNHLNDVRPARSLRHQQTNNKVNDVLLLPGTLDVWDEKKELEPNEKVAKDEGDAGGGARTPIKPITIKTSQIASSGGGGQRQKAKKHKKKKKKKKLQHSESEDEYSDYNSDPDFLIA